MMIKNRQMWKRREFLQALRIGASLAIPLVGAGATVGSTSAIAASEPAEPQHNGYRESEHVKTYYRLASF